MVIERIRTFCWQNTRNYKTLQTFLYFIKFLRPALPQQFGTEYYRKNSSWDLYPNICSCDIELVEYLNKNNIENKSIFHFGTGSHHIVGLENQKLSKPNEVIGITASVREHQAYVNLYLKERGLMKYYKVIFGDIYTLSDRCLPLLDIVTLFHLGEFYLPEEATFVNHNDESLLELFLDKLNLGGKIFFFTKSFAWEKALCIIQSFEKKGRIEKVEEYKSLLVYTKKADSK
ncbi:MAG: hypothetical protein V7L29_24480 [Nostoc sp.]|uniref:hypothetical protein n=1 Tax=Nostoc sp. TaxID=1180 RepID=UPI002FFAAD50